MQWYLEVSSTTTYLFKRYDLFHKGFLPLGLSLLLLAVGFTLPWYVSFATPYLSAGIGTALVSGVNPATSVCPGAVAELSKIPPIPFPGFVTGLVPDAAICAGALLAEVDFFEAAAFLTGAVCFFDTPSLAGAAFFTGLVFCDAATFFTGADLAGAFADFTGVVFLAGEDLLEIAAPFTGAGFLAGPAFFIGAAFFAGVVCFKGAAFFAGAACFTGAAFFAGDLLVLFAMMKKLIGGKKNNNAK